MSSTPPPALLLAAAVCGAGLLLASLLSVDAVPGTLSGIAFWALPAAGLAFAFAGALPARHDGVRVVGRRSGRVVLAYTAPMAAVGLVWAVARADGFVYGLLVGIEFAATVATVALLGWLACVAITALVAGPTGPRTDDGESGRPAP